MKMKKILIVLGIIIAILVMIVLVHTIRNYIIITDLQNKIAKYSISTNYYVKSVTKENDGTVSTIEDYKKDNKQATFLERKQKEESTKISIYYDGSSTDTFSETKDTKIAELDNSSIMSVDIYNNLETDNKWQTLLGCIMSRVKKSNYNGKECYIITNFRTSTSLTTPKTQTYIDKETGLPIKIVDTELVIEKEYVFNKVEDSIFIEPDINQYTLKSNS